MKAFVTDGDERPALAITRSLGRRGVSVLVGEEHPVSLASSSKYCVRHVTYPSPYRDPEAFRHFLIGFIKREKVDVIVPVTDVTTHSISLNQEELKGHSAIAAPPFGAFEFVANKWGLLQHAAKCGIPIPRTDFVDGITGLKDQVDQLEYPAVVKPVRSRILTNRGWLRASVHYAHSKLDLWRLYHENEYLASSPSLIQERIAGPGMGIFVLFDHGRLVAGFGHRRLREKPPSGGVSVLRESVPLDPHLRDHALRLLAPLGWHGVAMMEYKQDRRTGKLFLMEVNGRFWGSLQLAIDAGVDFPYLLHQLALGHRLEVPQVYRVGVKSRWLLGDLDHLLLRLFKANRDLHLPDSAPSKLRTLSNFLKLVEPGLRYEVVDHKDLRPFLYELYQYVKALSADATRLVRRRLARGFAVVKGLCGRHAQRGTPEASLVVPDAGSRITWPR
jgi:predicted ATP-grasp superfamily ATP-dependent carboligase